MPSAVYLHDGEHQITVTFRTETDRERFKAHYRALNDLGMQWRTERDEARNVLAWYADPKNWHEGMAIDNLTGGYRVGSDYVDEDFTLDEGKRARAALGEGAKP